MAAVFPALGGRKNALVWVAMLALAINDFVVLGRLSETTISYLVALAGIGVAGHVVEDGVKSFAERKKPKK